MNTGKRNYIGAIAILIGVLIVTIVLIYSIGIVFDLIRVRFNLPISSANNVVEVATAPTTELPSSISTSTPVDVKKLALNSSPYKPSQNVLGDTKAYSLESIRLLLNGDFDSANLHIQGNVTEKGNHFLNLVYGNIAGTLYGVRLSVSTLNTTATKESGGVFTDQSPIDIKIDLLNPVQFSTTRAEFEKNQQTSKLVNLWQSNLLPPTFISLIAVPFRENGTLGGAEIISTLEYTCSEGKNCGAALCSAGKLVTECLKDRFGTEAAKDWCKRAGYNNCSF